MVIDAQLKRCSRPECDVLNTGICVEGHKPPESCPFFGQASSDTNDDDENEDSVRDPDNTEAVEAGRVSLQAGELLSVTEVDQFLRWKAAKFIAIVGNADSGKTTLICSIYEKFLKGNFADYRFAGSRTLVGFEKKLHYSRIDSGRISPETGRTSLAEGLKYFHLSLSSCNQEGTIVELMLSDRSGEKYKNARDDTRIVTELIEIAKAQHIVLLLDGRRIANLFQRNAALQDIRLTINAFLDAGALSKNSRVQVVITKIDLLQGIRNEAGIAQLLIDSQTKLTQDFGDRLGELSFWEVAARDPHGIIAPALGVADLLASWCVAPPPKTIGQPPQIDLLTEFDRLLMRTPAGEIL